ncbi:hypothetical protein LT679_12520 [Mucilaginibacter roseus]|uniref:YfhD family protein n=1 Tax=Mucilaginibacter roseus TaxID=1528868 RepID=A0ABS8U553_9SPHI|nr:hypothetical protein [Mucilaginibacter roseus]MCD8741432.1 hypothetical protein [Mucilaginibacter roseus]
METNHDDLNYRDGGLNKEEGSAVKFNPDAQKHAIEAIEEDEAARIDEPTKKRDEEDDAMEAYGL